MAWEYWTSPGDGSAQSQLLAQGISLGGTGKIANSTCHSDVTFGPFAPGCREDFTLLFEESVFSILPSFCFIVLAALRLFALSGYSKIAEEGSRDVVLKFSKIVSTSTLTAINVAILARVTQQDSGINNVRLTAVTLSVMGSIFIGLVSHFEHTKTPRTSLLLNAYLLISLILATIRTRTAWLVFGQQVYTSLLTIGTALTAVVAILEAIPKTGWPSENISPEETSGLYALAFFTWLIPLIRLGSRKILNNEDLYQLDSRLSADTISKLFQKTWHDQNGRKKSGLTYILFKSLIWSWVQPIPIRLAMLGFAVSQPFFIRALVNYLEAGPTHGQTNASGLLFASILTYGGMAFSISSFTYLNVRFLAKVRTALVTAIFQKTVELNSTHLDTSVLTLMSTDIERIQGGLSAIHDLWALPIQITIASWLLYRQLGPAFVAPLVVVLLCALVSLGVSSYVRSGILRWTKRTEERVKLVNAVLSSIKSVKISGLAGPIGTLVQKFREVELRAGLSFRVVSLVVSGNAFFPTYMCGPITFFAAGQRLGAAEAFASLAYLQLITAPLNQLFQRIPMMVAALACLTRIQDFLEKESRSDYREFAEETTAEDSVSEYTAPEGVAISLSHLKVGWTEGKWQLSDLNVAISKSRLTIITGPVASGKSTFCKALLGEVLFTEGRLRFHQPQVPQIGYCDQTPFLTNDSVRSNIIGFAPFDGPLYDEILETVLLRPDLRTLPHADHTEVGSGGVTLSGGQKQRVALARALYLNADVYVLDDFTVGLDKPTADEIVRRLFRPGGFLSRRDVTVVWCTHNIQFLPLAHHIVALGSDGRVLHQGGPDEVLKDRQVALALQNHDDESPAKAGKKDYRLENAARTKSAAERNASRALNGAEVYIHYFSSINPLILLASLVTGLIFAFTVNFGLVWVKFWADNSLNIPGSTTHINAFYLGIYTAIQFLANVFLVLFLSTVTMGMAKVSGAVLHLRAIRALMGAPLHYLTKTDQGVIVNYFSQDMNLVDLVLPNVMMNTLSIGLLALGQSTLLLVGAPLLSWAYPPLALALYALARYYLRTSRQLRLMELEAKAPLYAQFGDAVRGLASVRAFGWAGAYVARHRALLDDSQRPLYLLEAAGLWLGLAVRLITALLAVGVTAVAVSRGGGGRGRAGFVGAGLVALMDFSGLVSTFVQCWVQFEMSLGAVKRLKEFGETAGSEDRVGEDLRPGATWPEKGEVVIEGVDASYAEGRYRDDGDDEDDDVTLALRGLSMRVAAGEKVAIVGRTGSGKSSLILLLLRLLDPTTAGAFTLDGLPLRRLHRDTLRQRVIAMPQDMVFLAAGETFRTALDPGGQATDDDECRAALERVGLLETVKEAGGLDAELGRDVLSQGQKQLFSLAAAVLRARFRERQGAGGGLLLLDEVTSNVDRHTETTIMGVIREVFKSYTVVAVTHSLESVVGFDKVFVLADGHVVKEGTPQSLIKEEEGTT